MGFFASGSGDSCFLLRMLTISASLFCSSLVNMARYIPNEVFAGRTGDVNQYRGCVPLRFFDKSDPGLLSTSVVILTWFLRRLLRRLPCRCSSSPSDSDESVPERLSSRSDNCQLAMSRYVPFVIPATNSSNSVSETGGWPLSFCFKLKL